LTEFLTANHMNIKDNLEGVLRTSWFMKDIFPVK